MGLGVAYLKTSVQEIDPRSTLLVTGPGGTVPFAGYLESIHSFGRRYQNIICRSHCASLHERSAYPRTYASGADLKALLDDAPGSGGLLFEASAMLPKDSWYTAGAPGRFQFKNNGSDNSRIGLNPEVWKSNSLMTRVSTVEELVSDSYYLDNYQFYAQFATTDDPFTYPIYIEGYKPTWVKKHPDAPSVLNAGRLSTSWKHTTGSFLERLFRSNNLEWEFVNSSDGCSYLNWGLQVGRGEPTEPVLSFVEGDNLLDYEVFYDGGYDVLDLEGAGDLVGSRQTSGYEDSGTFVERIVSEMAFTTQAQVENAASWEYGHRSDGWRIQVKAKEDTSILCGDYFTVELEGGTVYRPRVYKRRFRNGKMFLTGYNGRNPEY
jgi:hypothetical protein